ncbi:JmjC domain-containing protein [Metapseudomonas resinovorans]|uniref:JmjC domain-containing protein n=1 Tax=Metapseudomonas resinovorans TaxID=53412 RepID=UPI00048DE2B5|nr:cupin domain-containing protein [Pseudomonas resinovorans]
MRIAFGVTKSDFFDEYLYRKPHVFKGAIQGVRIGWKDISEIYERADASDRSFKLMDGREIPKTEYVESYMNVGRLEHRYIKSVIYRYMREGATLVFNRIKNEPFVTAISKQIANYAGAQVIVSGYAAFSGKSSYRSHWDTRDVFAVQLLGRKRWIIKRPNFVFPLFMQQTKNMSEAVEPEEVYLDVILEPGDIIYVPRGWWHNPLPLGGETFHLAVGTFAPTGFDYLRWLLNLLPEIPDVRKNFHDFERDKESLRTIAASLGAAVSDRSNFEKFMRAYIGQHRVDSKIALHILGDGSNHQLDLKQIVRLNANLLYRFSEGFVVINGNKINIDDVGFELIEFIHNQGICSVARIQERFSEHGEDLVNKALFQLALNDVIEIVD